MEKRIWMSSPHMGGNELKYINEAFEILDLSDPMYNQVIFLLSGCNHIDEDRSKFL